MVTAGAILGALANAGGGPLVALLPPPERDRIAHRLDVSPPHWSFAIGLVEALAGTALYIQRGLAWMCPAMQAQGMAVLENWEGLREHGHRITNATINWGGLLTWFGWNLQPEAWLLIGIATVGVFRCAAFAIAGEAVAEPAVWAGLRGCQLLRRRARARWRAAALGPPRPDTFLRERGDLVILTPREKPDWNRRVTVEVRGRFYQLLRVEDRPDGVWRAIAYVLREQPDEEVVRGLARYEEWVPPAPGTAGTPGTPGASGSPKPS
jgi:hypothetical protein